MATAKRPARRKTATLKVKPQRVTIDFVILGDFAQAEQGKLHVVGGGWTIHNATQYPSSVPFGLGIGILVPWTETNRKHDFKFAIRKEGVELANGGGEFEVGRQPGIPAGMTQRVVVGLSGQVQIAEPGTYEIQVTSGSDEKSIFFEALPTRR